MGIARGRALTPGTGEFRRREGRPVARTPGTAAILPLRSPPARNRTYDASEWGDALEEAADPDSEDPIDQLLDMPTLAAFLDAGLAAFDMNCDGIGQID